MFRSYIVSQFRDEDLENTISSTLPPSSNTGNMSHAYEEVIDSTSQSINSTISSFDEKQGQCQLLPSDTQRSKKLDIVLQQEVHGSSAYECIYVRMESGELNFVDREKIADLQYVNKPSVSNSDFTRYAGDEMLGESLGGGSRSQELSGIESRTPKSSRSESRSHWDKSPSGKSMSQQNISPSEESRSRESIKSSESRKRTMSDHDYERIAYYLAQEIKQMRKMEQKEEQEKVEKCDASTNTDSDSDSSTSLCNAISLQPKSSDVIIEVKAMSVDSGSQEEVKYRKRRRKKKFAENIDNVHGNSNEIGAMGVSPLASFIRGDIWARGVSPPKSILRGHGTRENRRDRDRKHVWWKDDYERSRSLNDRSVPKRRRRRRRRRRRKCHQKSRGSTPFSNRYYSYWGCFGCGDMYHFIRDCPYVPRCFHCGDTSHFIRDCWRYKQVVRDQVLHESRRLEKQAKSDRDREVKTENIQREAGRDETFSLKTVRSNNKTDDEVRTDVQAKRTNQEVVHVNTNQEVEKSNGEKTTSVNENREKKRRVKELDNRLPKVKVRNRFVSEDDSEESSDEEENMVAQTGHKDQKRCDGDDEKWSSECNMLACPVFEIGSKLRCIKHQRELRAPGNPVVPTVHRQ